VKYKKKRPTVYKSIKIYTLISQVT